jgi:hypothetical protein
MGGRGASPNFTLVFMSASVSHVIILAVFGVEISRDVDSVRG